MTTPTNGQRDGLEDRLVASFERATNRAEADLHDGRLAVAAIDRARRRGSPILRSGLVLAALTLLGAVAILAVGTRPAPGPISTPRAATSSGQLSASPWPTDASGSPLPARALRTPAPMLQPGQTFPATIAGVPVYSAGGPAESHIAQVADAAPFYVSGWVNGWDLQGLPKQGCIDNLPVPGATFDPARAYYDACWGADLSPAAGAPSSLHVLDEVSHGSLLGAIAVREPASAIQLVLKVHMHDPGCTVPECATEPVLDEVVLTGMPVVNPVILGASAPPGGPSLEKVVAKARDLVAQDFTANGVGRPVLLSVSVGTAAALHEPNVRSPATWEWRLLFASEDGTRLEVVWVSAATGDLTLEVDDTFGYWSTVP